MGRLIALFALKRTHHLVFALTLLTLVSGCATVAPTDRCAAFDRASESEDYDTRYAYSADETKHAARSFSRRPTRAAASATWYTLRINRSSASTCEHLFLIKDLYLQRTNEPITFEEQREFYTEKGQLIATKRENITAQLSKSGYYTASVPLPIPRGAPAGTYRVVTHLIATRAKGRTQTLATASSRFRVQ